MKKFIHLLRMTWKLWNGSPVIMAPKIKITGLLSLDGEDVYVRNVARDCRFNDEIRRLAKTPPSDPGDGKNPHA